MTNKTVVSGLKKRLEGMKGNWFEELSRVLWAYLTTSRRSIGETPFSMTYRAEATIPVEISLSSMRIASSSPRSNDAQMIKRLDLLEESRDMAFIWLADYQWKLTWGCNRNVMPREFVARDLVLQRAVGNMKDQCVGKLAPNWEGPYQVTVVAGTGA